MRIQVDPNPSADVIARIPALDGLRGFAILVVTLYRFAKEAFPESESSKVFSGIIKCGTTGVDLFFVLSGFLVTSILLNAKSRPHFFSQFYYRRALRIFPVYFASLSLFLFFLPWATGMPRLFPEADRNQFYLWTFTSNLKCCIEGAWCFGYLDHFWSLAIEEQFYITWPLIVFMLSTKLLLRFSMFAIAMCVVSRALFCIVSSNVVCSELFTLFRYDSLLLGACVAILKHSGRGFERHIFTAFLCVTFLGGALISVASLGFPTLRLQTTLVAVIWTTLLIAVLTAKSSHMLNRVFESHPLRLLGKHSYAMYVIQNPLIPIVSMAGLWPMLHGSVLGGVGYILVMSFVTFVASVVTWYLIEVWFLKLR